jgi:hypothetical protein
MDSKPVKVRRWTKCRRCRRHMTAGQFKVWLTDDTLFPELPGVMGGWACLACARSVLGETRIKVPA